MRLVVAVVSLVGLCACAPAPRVVQPFEGDIVIEVVRGENVPPGRVVLKPVPGGFLGSAGGGEMFRSRAADGFVRIDASTLAKKVSSHAVLLRSDTMNPGELAIPRELRVARVGTFFDPVPRSTSCDSYRTSLVTDSPHRGMLVYVDRAGSIRGSRYARPWIFEYDLEFPGAGLYLISSSARGLVVTQRVLAPSMAIVAKVRRVSCG